MPPSPAEVAVTPAMTLADGGIDVDVREAGDDLAATTFGADITGAKEPADIITGIMFGGDITAWPMDAVVVVSDCCDVYSGASILTETKRDAKVSGLCSPCVSASVQSSSGSGFITISISLALCIAAPARTTSELSLKTQDITKWIKPGLPEPQNHTSKKTK